MELTADDMPDKVKASNPMITNSLFRSLSILFSAVICTACATKQTDRKEWVFVSSQTSYPSDPNTCHTRIGKSYLPVRPSVDEPEKLWVQVPPTTEAKDAVSYCVSNVFFSRRSEFSKPEEFIKAVGQCLRDRGLDVQEEKIFIETKKFSC